MAISNNAVTCQAEDCNRPVYAGLYRTKDGKKAFLRVCQPHYKEISEENRIQYDEFLKERGYCGINKA